LALIKQKWGENSDVFTTACNQLAEGMRSAAIELHNNSHQYQLALEAINLASSLCRDAEIRQRIRNDQTRIKKKAELAQQDTERQRIDTCLDNLFEEIRGILGGVSHPSNGKLRLIELRLTRSAHSKPSQSSI